MDAVKLSELMMRLYANGKVQNEEESETLHLLANHMNQRKPPNACGECWFKRLLDTAPQAISERTPIKV